jgi:hypothetical protein
MPITIDLIKKGSADSVDYFKQFGITLDYSVESLKQIDLYFDNHLINFLPKEGEEIDKETQYNLFSVACYLGETLRKNFTGSKWETENIENIATKEIILKLSESNFIWPFERILKRFFNGPEDGIYAYGYFLTKDHFEKNRLGYETQILVAKKWWKLW